MQSSISCSARRNPRPVLQALRSSAPWDTEKRNKPCFAQGIPEATTFRPTEEEFKDPLKYIDSIRAQVSTSSAASARFVASRTPYQCCASGSFRCAYRRRLMRQLYGSLIAERCTFPARCSCWSDMSSPCTSNHKLTRGSDYTPRRRSAGLRAWCRRPASGRPSRWTGAPTASRRTASASPSASS